MTITNAEFAAELARRADCLDRESTEAAIEAAFGFEIPKMSRLYRVRLDRLVLMEFGKAQDLDAFTLLDVAIVEQRKHRTLNLSHSYFYDVAKRSNAIAQKIFQAASTPGLLARHQSLMAIAETIRMSGENINPDKLAPSDYFQFQINANR